MTKHKGTFYKEQYCFCCTMSTMKFPFLSYLVIAVTCAKVGDII